ncbi:hypothetical protein NUW58_g7916 [Xylaria curta]|uniref:Uncharacterized protein n=1 Tax=Xylaria curta TaxID=42375 RepID=A0ACC1NE64_9PEZI|nr:hypothetical protein NUW58_g7916 [Xylaria curta]
MPSPPIVESLSKRHPQPKPKDPKVANTPPGYDRGSNMPPPSRELVRQAPSNRPNPDGLNIVGLYVEGMAARSSGASSQATGSHNIRGGTITGCGIVTIGNTSSDNRSTPTLKRHVFSELRISHSKNVHIGNTGPGSEGHDITNPEIQGVAVVHIGDFPSMDVKQKSFSLANQALGVGK